MEAESIEDLGKLLIKRGLTFVDLTREVECGRPDGYVCPLQGTTIHYSREDLQHLAFDPNSPSIDRINNDLGTHFVCVQLCQ